MSAKITCKVGHRRNQNCFRIAYFANCNCTNVYLLCSILNCGHQKAARRGKEIPFSAIYNWAHCQRAPLNSNALENPMKISWKIYVRSLCSKSSPEQLTIPSNLDNYFLQFTSNVFIFHLFHGIIRGCWIHIHCISNNEFVV